MSGMYPVVAGSKFFIGGKIAVPNRDMTAADFASQTWVEVDGWVNAGEVGDSSEVISQNLINRGRTYKAKGTDDAGTSDQQFIVMASDAGQKAMNAAKANKCDNFAFKIEWGGECELSEVVTFTASEGTDTVVQWTGSNFAAGKKLIFVNEGGALPSGIAADTVYYVLASGLTADSFKISATEGGAAIQATDAGTGTTTASEADGAGTSMFAGIVTSNRMQGGDANAFRMVTYTVAINSNIVEV